MARALAPSPRRSLALALLALARQHAVDALRRAPSEASVVLVQGTNRPVPRLESVLEERLEALDSPPGTVIDWLGAAQVAAYAERHGYAYRMYRYNDTYESACWHPERGPLLAHWCKVAALRLAYERFPRAELLVWLDTDVIVKRLHQPIEDYLASTPLVAVQDLAGRPACGLAEPPRGRRSVSVFCSRDAHWQHEGLTYCGPNTGIMFLRRSDFTRRMLEAWWDAAMRRGIPGPYDQGFVTQLYAANRQDIAVLAEDALSTLVIPDVFAIHHCGKCNWLPNRTALFQLHYPSRLDVAGVNGALQRLQRSVDTEIRDRTLRHECSGCPRSEGMLG